jgi:hypothetical protein
MELRQYDLFEIIPGGSPRWIGAAATLEHARMRLRELATAAAGIDYFVREFRSGVVVAVASGARTGSARAKARTTSASGPVEASSGQQPEQARM